MRGYVFLALVVLISLASLISHDAYFRASTNDLLDLLIYLIPGFAFSVFILNLRTRKLKFLASSGFLLSLVIFYLLSFLAGLASWGLVVPLAGGIGAVLIKLALNNSRKIFDEFWLSFFGLGFLSSLVGLLYFYSTEFDSSHEGFRFGVIIVCWQIAIGIKSIVAVTKRDL